MLYNRKLGVKNYNFTSVETCFDLSHYFLNSKQPNYKSGQKIFAMVTMFKKKLTMVTKMVSWVPVFNKATKYRQPNTDVGGFGGSKSSNVFSHKQMYVPGRLFYYMYLFNPQCLNSSNNQCVYTVINKNKMKNQVLDFYCLYFKFVTSYNFSMVFSFLKSMFLTRDIFPHSRWRLW